MSRTLACLIAIVVASTTASAQTRYITGEITSGSFTVDTSTPAVRASYDLTGPGFHFVADRVEGGIVYALATCPSPGCRAGDPVSLSASFIGTTLGAGLAAVGSDMLTPAYFSGALTFLTEPVILPRGHRRQVIVRTTFTLIGAGDEVAPELDARTESGESWSEAMLLGRGTVTAFFRRVDSGRDTPERFHYALERITYTFSPQVTAPQ